MITNNNKNTTKSLFKRFIIGAKKGLYTPTLPEKILIFNNYPLVRIFRVLGGLSYLILLGKHFIHVSLIIKVIAFFIALLFLIYHLILTFYRIKHVYYLLKSDELNIRNSPLDTFASLVSKALLGLKGIFSAVHPIGVTLGLMLGSDEILKAAYALCVPLVGIGTAILNKTYILNTEHKHNNPNVSRVLSPDNSFINSLNEFINTTSIEDILYYSLMSNVLIFILFIILFIIIRYLLTSNVLLFDKYKPNIFNVLFKKKLNNSNLYNDRLLLLMLLIISINLIFMIILNIIVSAELFVHTDNYIKVDNVIKNNLLLFWISLYNKDKIVNNNYYNNNNNINNNMNKKINLDKRYYSAAQITAAQNINNVNTSRRWTYKNKILNDIVNASSFSILESIINEEDLSNENKQMKIEQLVFDEWDNEYLNLLKNNKKLFTSGFGIEIISAAIKNLVHILDDYKNSSKFMKGKPYKDIMKKIDSLTLISIVLSYAVPFCFKFKKLSDQKIIKLYVETGKSFIKYFYKMEFDNNYINHNQTKDKFYTLILSEKIKINIPLGLNYIEYKNWIHKNLFINENEHFFAIFGADIMEFIGNKGEFYNIKYSYDKKDKKSIKVMLPDKYLEYLHDKHKSLTSLYLPMLTKPLDWDIHIHSGVKHTDMHYDVTQYGGFLTNTINKQHFIHNNQNQMGKTLLTNNSIINTLNKIQSVPFKINKVVLDYLLDCIEADFDFKDHIILIKHPETKFLYDLNLNKQNNQQKAKLLEILRQNSQYYHTILNLSNALLLYNQTFYHPAFVDWRGRIYTSTNSLSFQSNEFTKSLIMFKEGYILNDSGVESLKIYLANCYGKNKLSIIDRLSWVDANIDQIIDIKNKFWFTAKEPFLFLAASCELKHFLLNPKTFISHLPIYVDATCNGLQHLAAMTSDITLAKYVNLLKTSINDEPDDIYNEMLNIVNLKIKDKIQKNPKYGKLYHLKLDRNFVKRGIMTIPYGATIKGLCTQLISENFILSSEANKLVYQIRDMSICNLPIKFEYGTIFALAAIIHDVLFISYPKLTELVKYLKKMNTFIKNTNLNIPIAWTTPSGLIIEQKYIQFEKNKYNYSVLGKRKSLTLRTKKDKINLRKQNEGIIPNIVHSMDAANVSLLLNSILNFNNNINVITVHDCFGTQANFIDLLSLEVKLAFLNIYSKQNFVEEYHNFIISYLENCGLLFNEDKSIVYIDKHKPLNLPKLPIFNKDIDLIHNILDARYFVN